MEIEHITISHVADILETKKPEGKFIAATDTGFVAINNTGEVLISQGFDTLEEAEYFLGG